MDDYQYLYLVHHELATCGTCRARRGEGMVCAICKTPFTPDKDFLLFYISHDIPPHYGIVHTSCSESITYGATDDTFIYY